MYLMMARLFKWKLNGKVDWFNRKKGFGFIKLDDKQSVFVHSSSIQSKGYFYLKPNQNVAFKIAKTDRGLQAVDVQVEKKAQ